ncbi:hypothetical protein CCACVL1_21813 [Corchorus capsularis]|uniref:Uncharacterized protein n=1 Tax=Corchorus capsularis TaxID=210143 RepID=A0A1R3H1Y5_COCAP|nr:hypothetical protein CCACVL1_21813 [Corchorus capsularis]
MACRCREEPYPHLQNFGNYPTTPARLGSLAAHIHVARKLQTVRWKGTRETSRTEKKIFESEKIWSLPLQATL